MERIAFVTDSTAYLTPAQIEEYGITVVPLTVILGDKAYREGVDITADQFYSMLAASPQFPTTSQPAVGEFAEAFERLLKDHDIVLCLLLSSGLSGTYHAAQTAANMVGGRVIVVDSRITSYGIAGPLIDGVKLARRGGTVDEILKLWNEELQSQKAFFVIDTLEYLHRGGRIGGAAAVFGALLQIKPILTMRDGKIDLFEKVRTHRRAMERMLAELDKDASTGEPLQGSVVHSRRLEDAQQLREELVAKYPNLRLDVSELGPVIGAHTGPGVLALIYHKRMLPDD